MSLRLPARIPMRLRLLPGLVFAALLAAGSAHAQGCSACRQATAGSTPRQQAGLRRGILVLGLPAGAVFLGVLIVARKIENERAG